MTTENPPVEPAPTEPAPPSEPTPNPAPPAPSEPDKAEQTGHMVYDLTLKRFVGRIGESKSAAEKTVNKVKGHRYETRKV